MTNVRPSPLPSNSFARYGCYIGLLVALGLLGIGLVMIESGSASGMPLKLAILAAGVVQAVTCYYTLLRNRAAWSFALAQSGTLSVVFLLGAPKVSKGWDIPLAAGFVPALLFIVTTILLASSSDEF